MIRFTEFDQRDTTHDGELLAITETDTGDLRLEVQLADPSDSQESPVSPRHGSFYCKGYREYSANDSRLATVPWKTNDEIMVSMFGNDELTCLDNGTESLKIIAVIEVVKDGRWQEECQVVIKIDANSIWWD